MAQATIRAGGAPVADDALVTADQDTILGSGTAFDPLRAAHGGAGITFDAITVFSTGVVVGMAIGVALGTAPRSAQPATGNSAAQVWGVALETAASGGHTFPVQNTGIVTLTTDEWDTVAGTSGGLTRGLTYYVSQSTPGHLTSTPPTTGQHMHVVGLALSTTQLLLVPTPSLIAP